MALPKRGDANAFEKRIGTKAEQTSMKGTTKLKVFQV